MLFLNVSCPCWCLKHLHRGNFRQATCGVTSLRKGWQKPSRACAELLSGETLRGRASDGHVLAELYFLHKYLESAPFPPKHVRLGPDWFGTSPADGAPRKGRHTPRRGTEAAPELRLPSCPSPLAAGPSSGGKAPSRLGSATTARAQGWEGSREKPRPLIRARTRGRQVRGTRSRLIPADPAGWCAATGGSDHRFPQDHLPKDRGARAELLKFTRRSG